MFFLQDEKENPVKAGVNFALIVKNLAHLCEDNMSLVADQFEIMSRVCGIGNYLIHNTGHIQAGEDESHGHIHAFSINASRALDKI
jgi:hypothetical protein